MNIDIFYTILQHILPYNSDKDRYFRVRLSNALGLYCELIKELDIDGVPLKKDVIQSVYTICNKIKAIVKSSMEGLPSIAFAQLHNFLYNKEVIH